MDGIARQVVATGTDAAEVASRIVDGLAAPGLRLALVFADWRLDAATIAGRTQRALAAPVVGGSVVGVIGKSAPRDGVAAVGLGLYTNAVRVGIGVAPDLPKSALTRSRDAVSHAAAALGTTAIALDPSKHVALTFFDGTCGHEEAFCIGSAAAAPQIRFVGGGAGVGMGGVARGPGQRARIWVNGEVMLDAAAVVLLELGLPFVAVTSSHQLPTEAKTVVTSATGRVVEELDGRPAARRLREILGAQGEVLDEARPAHGFARYIDGVPYVRTLTRIDGERLCLASNVEAGQVLRVMRPGDLIGTTTRDLELASEKLGGQLSAFLAFSCLGRHWDAQARNLERALAGAYAAYAAAGCQSFGEQSGMLFVNHTLTGLAIGRPRGGGER